MSWSHDIDAMPKGGLVERSKGAVKAYMEWEAPFLIVATKCRRVLKTHWLPPDPQYRKVGRWRMMNEGEQPIAWQPWPTYP